MAVLEESFFQSHQNVSKRKKEIGEPLFTSCPNCKPVRRLPHHGLLGGILFPISPKCIEEKKRDWRATLHELPEFHTRLDRSAMELHEHIQKDYTFKRFKKIAARSTSLK
jgi:predicted transposase YbfD/YdcC